MKELEKYLKKRFTKGTTSRYMRSIEEYILSEGDENALTAKYRSIWDYIGKLRSKGYSSAYINTELAAIKNYYKYLIASKQRFDNPTSAIFLNDTKRSSREIQHQDLFSPAELELLLNKKARYSLLEFRDKLAVSLYIYQGMTTGEIVKLRLSNLNLDEQTVYIPASSKINSRIIPLKSKQIMFAERYIHFDRASLIKEPSEMLFLNKLGNEINGESLHYLIESQRGLFQERKLNPKTVRQSVIVNWFSQGHGIKDVQIMAGHKYPSTTESYKPNDLEELKSSIGKFHPLGGIG